MALDDTPLSSPDPVPYGTDRLENTNLEHLKTSLTQQIENVDLPQPKVDLHPAIDPADFTQAAPHADSHGFVGNGYPSNKLLHLNNQSFINPFFPSQKSTTDYNINPSAFNAFALLHEAAHYVSYKINFNAPGDSIKADNNSDKTDLIDKTVNDIDKVFLNQIIKSPGTSPDKVALMQDAIAKTYDGIPDRIADASATLYALSNYSDHTSTLAFLRKF